MTTSHGRARINTSWAGTQDSKVERTVARCMELFLQNYPRQIVLFDQCRRRVSNHAWISFFRTEKHYRIDATTSTLQRIANEPSFVDSCPSGCEKFSFTKGQKSIPIDQHARFVTSSERSAVRHEWINIHVLDDARFTGRMTYARKEHIATIVELTLAQLRVTSTMNTRQYFQHHRIVMVSPTDHVPKDTMTTEQQLDLATRMVLEQVLLMSDGDYKQSTMHQLPLHYVDGTAELNTAFASIREPSTPKKTKYRVYELLILSQTTAFGRL